MNLFSNIFDQFTGQAQPQVPSFGTPQAPRTTSYVAPNIPTTQTNTGIGSTTTQKPINTSLPMGIPEPILPIDTSVQMKEKFGFNDKDIEFLRQAKQKGYDSKSAFEYITKKKEQEKQGEDLGFFGSIGEGITGGFRVGEQIPRYTGNLLNLTQKYVTTPLVAGGLEAIGAEETGQKFRSASEKFGAGAKALGEEITRAGEGDITEKQREARRFGASMVATAPIPLGTASKFVQGAGLAKTALRGAIAGGVGTPVYTALEEGRLPTAPEQITGTVGGAILGPLVEKVAIPGVQKGIEFFQKNINPTKFTQQIDDETVKLVRQAIRPSTTGVDTAKKFDLQDAKLLQGVKEVVKQGKAPKTAKELMQAIQDTKQNIWSKVEQANKAVVKTTTGDDIAIKLRSYVADPENKTTFLSRPELKANLLKYADEVQANKDFSNITQQELQDVLTDINSRIPASSFLKQLDANPTQTAQNTVIAKIYRDIIDDNLENAVGKAGKEARQAYGSVRQLEKDFAKRYGVYLRQNPKGLADMFGMEGFADIAAGLLTSSPSQVIKGVAIQGAKKLIKNANNPDTIIRDIFKLQSKVKPNIIKNANTPLNSNIPPVVNPNAVKKVKGQTVKPAKNISDNAKNDYLELKSLEESLKKGDEFMKAKAREAFNKKIEQVKVEMDRAIYERAMTKEMRKLMRENTSSIYPEGMQTVFNKLKGYTKNKGNYNDIEGESGSSILKKRFSDYTNEYNEKMGTNFTVNEMWDKFDDRYRKNPIKEIKKPIVKPKKITK